MVTVVGRPLARTQAERRAASRVRILDAALLCLAERGYAGTTFPEVLRRAGLSNGALWRHFRSKGELLAAALLHAEEGLLPDELSHDPSRTPTQRLDDAVAYLWAHSSSPALQATVELLQASKVEEDLRAALVASDRRAGELFFRIVRDVAGPDLANHPRFERNVRLLGLALYGVTLTGHLRSPAGAGLLLAEVQGLARHLFDLEPGTPASEGPAATSGSLQG